MRKLTDEEKKARDKRRETRDDKKNSKRGWKIERQAKR